MWNWLRSRKSEEPTAPEDKSLIRALSASIHTGIGQRRNRVLHAYMQSGSASVAGTRAMVASGVPVDATNHDDDTPFLIAVRKGREPLARVLLELGADVNHRNRLARSALHEAANAGSLTMVKLLLTFRAAMDLKDLNGNTPLHLAAMRGNAETVEFLIRAGMRPDTLNREGKSAFAMAPEALQRKMTTWWLETTSRLLSRKK